MDAKQALKSSHSRKGMSDKVNKYVIAYMELLIERASSRGETILIKQIPDKFCADTVAKHFAKLGYRIAFNGSGLAWRWIAITWIDSPLNKPLSLRADSSRRIVFEANKNLGRFEYY